MILASGESSALLDEALDADGVADVLLLPQLTENVVFALRKAGHAGRRLAAEGGHARQGRIITVFSPKGGTGKTVTATNLAASFAKHEEKRTLLLDLDLQFGDAAIMLGHRAREDDLRPRGRSGRARLREARGLRHEAHVRPRHPAGAVCAPRTPSS